MQSHRMILAALLLVLAALSASMSYAETVTFSFTLSCDIYHDANCPIRNLYVARRPGDIAGDYVTIASVNSDVPGYTQPVPINGGNLRFTSSPATRVLCDPPPSGCYAIYDNPGGKAGITGSVFGLPDGATLLTASFQGGAQSYFNLLGDARFSGPTNISFINPVILANLGLPSAPNCGTGYLADAFYAARNDGIEYFGVSVTFTPGSCYSYSVIHNFTGGRDGTAPFAGLTMDAAGNLYGTTYGGSPPPYNGGSVFKLKHFGSGWVLNPLYDFANGNDGFGPWGRVALAQDGTLYGTTQNGGAGGSGTVFHLTPLPTVPKSALAPWNETVTYPFTGGSDGAYPSGDLIFDSSGNIYGTTPNGGTGCAPFGCGLVYELTPSGGGWTQTVLYSFQDNDGANPVGGVIFDKAGNLYGVLHSDGPQGYGAVYELSPSESGWTEKAIYVFTGGSDGANPSGGLIIDGSGNLYGTTLYGGVGSGGTVFELTPADAGGWSFNTLYRFSGGAGPDAKLVMDGAGNLYGTTFADGVYGYGSVFKLTPSSDGWTYTSLHDFTGGSDGGYAFGNIVFDRNGNLCGTASQGGDLSTCNGYGCGVVFEMTPF